MQACKDFSTNLALASAMGVNKFCSNSVVLLPCTKMYTITTDLHACASTPCHLQARGVTLSGGIIDWLASSCREWVPEVEEDTGNLRTISGLGGSPAGAALMCTM